MKNEKTTPIERRTNGVQVSESPAASRPSRGRVTMRTVAEAVGVTPATVSMALANHHRISAATRLRVQRVAQEMGYAPNPFVSALMRTRRSGRDEVNAPVIALVNLHPGRDGWTTHPSLVVRQMRRGAQERARQLGYRVEEFWFQAPGMSAARLSDILYARSIRGVVFSPPADPVGLPTMKWNRISPVALATPRPEINVRTVCCDHHAAMIEIMATCQRRGYRRPGLIVDRAEAIRLDRRWEAGLALARDLFPALRPVPVLQCDGSSGVGSGVESWLAQHRPDVVIATGGEAVVKEIQTLEGWESAPAGLVWTNCPHLEHPVSGICPNGALLGSAAIDVVVEMVEQNECGLEDHVRALMIRGAWNEGGTLPVQRRDERVRLLEHPAVKIAC